VCAVFEPAFIATDWWDYYGYQALDMTGIPMWWWFVNATTDFVLATAIYLLRRHVVRRRHDMATMVVLLPLLLFAVHGSMSLPSWLALAGNSERVAFAAGLVCVAIAGIYFTIVSRLVATEPAGGLAPKRGRGTASWARWVLRPRPRAGGREVARAERRVLR
jgi:hypothetical protein